MNAQRALGKNTDAQSKVLEKLSSGYAINRAADDAAGLSISQKMRSSITALERSSKNAQDGISYVQTAEGALDEVSTMLTRCTELAEQKLDGALDTEDIQAIKDEMNELSSQIKCIIEDTKFNGKNITDELKFGIEGTDSSLGVGTTISDPGVSGDDSVNDITTKVKTINQYRSLLCAQQNRLEYAKNNLDTTAENLQSAESRIRDTDMASAMSDYTKYNILTQAATSMLSQANSAPQSILSLLQ
jgi:flagellin